MKQTFELNILNVCYQAKANLYNDSKELFTDKVGDGSMPDELYINDLFDGQIFKNKVNRFDKEQVIVINIEHHLDFEFGMLVGDTFGW